MSVSDERLLLVSYGDREGYISTDPVATPIRLTRTLELAFQHTAKVSFRAGGLHATTTAYTYQVISSGRSLLEYHYHPTAAVKHCHLHARAHSPYWTNFRKIHLATGRVAFEDVLLMLINDFGVPAKRGARGRLLESRSTFEGLRTWSGPQGAVAE